MAAMRTLVGVFVNASTTRARVVGLGLLAVLTIALAIVVAGADDADADAPGELIDTLGLTLIVPIGSLLIATATLGQLRSEGSLIYVWLRPVSRTAIAVSAWLAAIIVTLPAVVLPLSAAAAISGGGGELVVATALASAAGVLAYCGVFTLLGTVAKQAAIWGVVYVLIWEGVLAALGSGINRLALRSYTRSILERVGDVDLPLSGTSTAVALVVLLGVAAVSVGLTALRLRRIDVE